MNETNKLSVLVVDDSPALRERLVEMLSGVDGLEVVGQAENASEAISLVEFLRPELVVLDIQMPGVSGLEVLRQIKAVHAETRVAILTNHVGPEYRKRCGELQADYFLSKTTDSGLLIEIGRQLAAEKGALQLDTSTSETKLSIGIPPIHDATKSSPHRENSDSESSTPECENGAQGQSEAEHAFSNRCHELFENARDIIYMHDLNGKYIAANAAASELTGYSPEEIMQMSVCDVVAPEYRSDMNARIVEKIANGEQTNYEVEIITRKGSRLPLEISSRVIFENGRPVAIQGIGRDISQRKRLEREREAMSEIIRAVSTSLDLEELLKSIHSSIARVLYAENCFVALCDEATGTLSMEFIVDQYEADSAPQKMGKGCAAYVFRTRQPHLITDEVFENLLQKGDVELVGEPSPSWLGVPLQTPANTIGVLVVQDYVKADAYTQQDLEFLTSVGSQIAVAIQRKKSEAALRESEARLSGIIESAMDAIVTVDESQRIIIFNKAAETIFGCSAEDVIGTSIQRFIPQSARGAHEVHVDGFRGCGATARRLGSLGSITGVRADGEEFPLEASISKVISGSETYCTVILRDVTERRRAELALEKRARQQAVVAELGQYALTANDVADVLDTAVRMIADSLNVELCKVLEFLPKENALVLRAGVGWKPEYQIGSTKVCSGADSQAGFTLVSNTPVIVEDLNTETRFNGPSLLFDHGVRSGVSLIIGGNGVPFGVLGAHSASCRTFTQDDINFLQSIANLLAEVIKRQRAEEALRASRLQLLQSQRLEAIGQLAGGVAHDFNNLLTAIIGYSDLTLAKLDPADRIARNIREVRKAGQRAAGLTRQLLAFSRKQILEPRTIDLNAVVTDINKMLHRLIGEDIELITNCADNLGTVKADPTQIEQVLMNLVVNARDAMPDGGRLLIETRNVTLDAEYISKHHSAQSGEYVMLAVTDTGCGMDDETQARIFEPFFTTKDLGKGTGLGLSTIYGIVKQSGGYIWVYSEIDKGSTFKVYLPRTDEPLETTSAGDVFPQIEIGSGTLLLVEDDPSVRGVTARFLELAGYKVLQASSGNEALEIVKARMSEIRLVITDVVMPEMSGRVLAERLAELIPNCRVMFISGYTDDAIVRAGIVGKNMAFLEKPFTPHSLAQKVRDVLELSTSSESGSNIFMCH